MIKGLYINDISLQNAGVGQLGADGAEMVAPGGPGGPVVSREY